MPRYLNVVTGETRDRVPTPAELEELCWDDWRGANAPVWILADPPEPVPPEQLHRRILRAMLNREGIA